MTARQYITASHAAFKAIYKPDTVPAWADVLCGFTIALLVIGARL